MVSLENKSWNRLSLILSVSLFLFSHSGRAEFIESVKLPAEKVKGSAALVVLKKAEDEEKWEVCAALGAKTFKLEPRVKGWVLATWLRCARKADALTTTNLRLKAALKESIQDLQEGAFAKSLLQERLKARFLVIEKELTKAKPALIKELDLLLEEIEPSDRESKAKALGLYGDLALLSFDVEAAKLFFEQSLTEKEDATVRAKYARAVLVLNQKPNVKVTSPEPSEIVSEGERQIFERFEVSQKKNDLMALVEDGVTYLNKYPQGTRSKWVEEKIEEIYRIFLEKSLSGEEKWIALRDRTLVLMMKAEPTRISDWARQLHRRNDYIGGLRLAEKALSEMPLASVSGILHYVAGRSAQLLGLDDQAQDHFEKYIEAFSGGEEINEVLFRLGLVHARRGQFQNAVGIFEKLLSLKNKGRFELGAHYWLVRCLQETKSPRATGSAEELIRKFPFTYYGLKLAAESQKGLLEWPASNPQKSIPPVRLPLTGPQKKAWDRIRLLSASGWRVEALSEIMRFPNPKESWLKALLAGTWSEAKAYSAMIRLLDEASVESTEFRSKELFGMGFPKDFTSLVEAEAKKNHLQPILVWSLMRQESAFHTRAVSTSNALGLMQLIPPTAREVADRLKLGSLDLPDDAFQPQRNISMGTSYLAQMIRRFDQSVPMGLAAYNAGPSRMLHFLQSRPKLRAEITRVPEKFWDELWIDELPWFETSFYVKAILRNTLLYRLLDQGRVQLEQAVWRDLIEAPERNSTETTSSPVPR